MSNADELPCKLVKFESVNVISVNVFGTEKGTVYPIHLTKQRAERLVDLLPISNGQRSHYCWIKNLNRSKEQS